VKSRKVYSRAWGHREGAAVATGKIVFLLVLVAIFVAVFHVRLWMEKRKSEEKLESLKTQKKLT
jgi:cell division protein FtsX